MKILRDSWLNCYPSSWKGMIVPDAIKHPAKFSSRLIDRIYEHMDVEGWIQPGDMILDSFAGVALGALDCMRRGLRWRGIELEANFADLGNQNIAMWNKRFSIMPHWCQDAKLLHGDSRHLLEVLRAADGAVSSPPYAEARIGQESGQEQCGRGDQYGATEGQLGAMRADGFEAALSSPPYGGMGVEKNSKSIDREKQYEVYRASGGGQSFEAFCRTQELHSQDYGTSEGQLSHMPTNGYDDAVSSPPFQGSQQVDNRKNPSSAMSSMWKKRFGETTDGTHPDQISNLDADSFWLAARQIVDQVFLALKPGGHAVWVCKRFVKGGKIQEFSQQWAQLCEAAGFRVIHWHKAMLTNHKGASYTLDGGLFEHKTEAKSFFRRNGEKKSRAAAWWEACSLSRVARAAYLRAAHAEKWAQWHAEIEKHPKRPVRKPKRFIIVGKAQMTAYEDAGSPAIEISTSIDWEDVICMVKPEA